MEESIIKQLTTLVERTTRVEAKLDLSLQINEASNKAEALLTERVAKVESSSKSAHKRIDEVENQRKEDRESTHWAIGIGVAVAGVLSSIIALFVGR